VSRRDALAQLGRVKDPSPWGDLSAPTVTLFRGPDAPIVLPVGVTLDATAAVRVRDGHSAPGRGLALGSMLAPETLVWARHAGWWRHGMVDGEPVSTRTITGHAGRQTTVLVIYTADRTGRLDRHRWPVSELRLREPA